MPAAKPRPCRTQLLLAGALTLTSVSGAAHAVATIELPVQIQVHHLVLRLGDVALISSPELAQLKRLMQIPLGRLPASGGTVDIERETLARWIRAQAGMEPQQILWKGAPVVSVSAPTQVLRGETVVATARTALRNWLDQRSQRADLQVMTIPDDVEFPAAQMRFSVRPLNDDLPRKRMVVWVDAFADAQFVRTIPVTFEVSAWADGLVAESDTRAGQALADVLAEARLTTRAVDLTRLAAPVLSKENIADKRLRRNIAAGAVLTAGDVESRPTVVKGEQVALQINHGAIALESRAEIMQDGVVGQTVRVRLLRADAGGAGNDARFDTHDGRPKYIRAQVTGPGQVVVQR